MVQAVIVATSGPGQKDWIEWMKKPMDIPDPDLYVDSGGEKYEAIAAKRGLAMTKIVQDAEEDGNTVALQRRT